METKLNELAVILQKLGVRAKVVVDHVTFGDGKEVDNSFVTVERANCAWGIWHYDRLFEVHFWVGDECKYDTVYFNDATLFGVVGQIAIDYDKYGK